LAGIFFVSSWSESRIPTDCTDFSYTTAFPSTFGSILPGWCAFATRVSRQGLSGQAYPLVRACSAYQIIIQESHVAQKTIKRNQIKIQNKQQGICPAFIYFLICIKNLYMNKIKLIMLWCLLLGSFVSCTKKDNEEPQPESTATNDYLPTTANSSWEYGGVNPYKLTATGATKVINGKTYQELETNENGVVQKGYVRKENGVYTAIGMLNAESTEMIVLKDNAPVGESWEYKVPFSTLDPEGLYADMEGFELFEGLEAKTKYTIEAKDVTKTVEGKTYKNVIGMKYEVSVVFMGQDMVMATAHYYFAKGVGLILSDLETIGQVPLLTYEVK
jgi:hypothetical protein